MYKLIYFDEFIREVNELSENGLQYKYGTFLVKIFSFAADIY